MKITRDTSAPCEACESENRLQSQSTIRIDVGGTLLWLCKSCATMMASGINWLLNAPGMDSLRLENPVDSAWGKDLLRRGRQIIEESAEIIAATGALLAERDGDDQ